jgi:uncharacterized protein YcnI
VTSLSRGVLIAAVTAAVMLTTAAPAFAHVQVSADKPQAGATDVTVQFSAESESTTAGARMVQVQLPDGIPPAAVSYVSGPAGWTLTHTADGYLVGGNTLAVHKDIIYRVKIAKLPDGATSLAFKTVVTYGNNQADRWIEVPQAGQPEPPHPAPVLTLEPAAAPAPSATPPPGATPASAGPSSNAPAAAPAAQPVDFVPWLIGGAVLLVVLVAAGIWLGRRRRPGVR